ncbi:cysteine dioxygenase family protein [Pandoraea thiooxydans]|uniref:cysteine dioxygenase family protein n=1 Tax=Pandoraea thiooxydans TaxID=445709 RepID=UPI0009F84C89|nr:cysteine dioxygenase family protein [Pandoraea thiooxydans]
MPSSLETLNCVSEFAQRIETIVDLPWDEFRQRLPGMLHDASDLGVSLTEAQRLGEAQKYARHILHADAQGRFTVMALIWREGQFSPIHGHWTWCGYAVLEGSLTEEHFHWSALSQTATLDKCVERPSGSVVISSAGLNEVHRLGNAHATPAVSLHVYGVAADLAATRVNRVVTQ